MKLKTNFLTLGLLATLFAFISCDILPDITENDDDNDYTEIVLDYSMNIEVKDGVYKGKYTNDIKNSFSAPTFEHSIQNDEYNLVLSFNNSSLDESLESLLLIHVKLDKLEKQTITFDINDNSSNGTIWFTPTVDRELMRINSLASQSGTITIERISKKHSYILDKLETGFVDVKLTFSGLFNTMKYIEDENGEPDYIEEKDIEVIGTIETVYLN